MYNTILIVITLCIVSSSEASSLNVDILSRDLDLLGVQKRSPGDSLLCDCQEYKIFKTKMSWGDAQTTCGEDGGTLADVFDKQTDKMLRQAIKNNNLEDGLGGFWIALNDIDQEGDYVWSNGEPLQECSYTNWAARQPNNKKKSGQPDGQDCTQLWAKSKLHWDDTYCTQKKGFICQYPGDCPPECDQCAVL
ncbi:lectin BRA-3-like [Saccoglossus kowalevskii]|uniref:Lectin BRA-3-like n=1 Tax=Saccoglossus kowalevskii TaxID=10224 RepID=A0ABM0GRT2_SACKO|nr:PREDICTED: lectin BRA-3-like [Saccoglossus kowalevskii]